MTHHDPLRDTLRSRADHLGDASPLSLDDVKGRARGIRRRRAAVSGLAAAAVLAVAVPMGIAVTDRIGAGPENPPVAGPTASPTSTPSEGGESTPDATPKGGVRIALTTEIDGTTYAPGIPLLNDRAIVMPNGSEVPVDADYSAFAPLGDGWVAMRNDEGNFSVDVLDADGEVLTTDSSTWSLAVSEDGSVVSWATPDGELMTVTEGAEPAPLIEGQLLPGRRLDPVAVIGSGSCDPDGAGGGCTVLLSSEDDQGQGAAHSVTSKGIINDLPGLLSLGGMSPGGSLSGVVSATDTGSCGVVLGEDWEPLWKTCDHTLGQFSPDGRYVIGHPAYLDGAGDGSIAILDAATGDLLVQATNSAEHQSMVNNAVWDTDGTVLMTVFEEGTWSLMRLTPEGSLSTVAAGLGDNMDEVPLRLITRP